MEESRPSEPALTSPVELDLSLDDRLTTLDQRLTLCVEQIQRLTEGIEILGQQSNWLVENLTQMFAFMGQVSANGGGLRGLMSAMRSGPPQVTNPEPEPQPEESRPDA